MNEEKEVKSIKLSMPYVTEDGKDTLKDLSITFKKVIECEKGAYLNGRSPLYSMDMSIVIPDHIHKRLCGEVVRRRNLFGNKNDDKIYDTKFSKTITRPSLEALTIDYREIIYDYRWLLSIDRIEVKKVIYYTFDGEIIENNTSQWDRKILANDSNISYSYMVGFISADKKHRLNIEKKILGTRDGSQMGWAYVEYTPEREFFFKSIFDKFNQLLSQLNNFKEEITPSTIDTIIKSGIKLLN